MSRARSTQAVTRVELFGGPVARIRGKEVTFSPHQMALVALIFGHREGRVSRAEAIWLIWEEDDGPGPRHKLRQLLRDVQERMEARIVESKADPLQADTSVTSSDLDDFFQSLDDGELLSAAKTMQLGFAAKLAATSAPFADWLEARRAPGPTRPGFLPGQRQSGWKSRPSKYPAEVSFRASFHRLFFE